MMERYAVTIDYCITVGIEADSEDDAAAQGHQLEVGDAMPPSQKGMVVHVEVE